jgi:hypothetical protein
MANCCSKGHASTLYWFVLSLITFLGLSAVIKIEATRTRLSLVVAVVGVAFSAACFLERLLRVLHADGHAAER